MQEFQPVFEFNLNNYELLINSNLPADKSKLGNTIGYLIKKDLMQFISINKEINHESKEK